MQGGRFGNKPESWAEILGLFPPGSLQIQVHPVSPHSENEWLRYLERHGVEAVPYWYADHPGPHEGPAQLDISACLKRIPLLTPEPQDVKLPERFVTVQWDSTGPSRSLSPNEQARILARYKAEGFEAVTVGGEARDPLRWSLAHIAYAMSKAAFHVGVDSGFMHLAQLYLPLERIHLYTHASMSHHIRRARDNGARINPYQ